MIKVAVTLLSLLVAFAFADILAGCRPRARSLDGETFDFVIVGAGTAGCVLANRLSNSNFSVLLLEAGPSESVYDFYTEAPSLFAATFGSGINWNYLSVPQTSANNNRIYLPRIKRVGGCSRGNANIYNRGTKHDYDNWAQSINDNSWKWDNVLPYFKKSEKNTRATANPQFHGTNGEWVISDAAYIHNSTRKMIDAALQAGETYDFDHSDGTATGITVNQVSIFNGERFSTDKAFLAPVVNRTNLYVKPDAPVKRIIFNNNKKAVAVEFKDKANGDVIKRVNIRREIVLASGVFGSAHLLLASGVGPRAHLESVNVPVVANTPKVGKELHDHIILGVTARVQNLETFDENIFGANILPFLNEWNLNKTGPLTSNVPELTGLYKSHLANSEFSGRADMQYICAPAMYIKQAAVSQPGNFSITFGVSLATPFSRGEILLASNDSEVDPLINPNYLADSRDTSRLVEAMKRIRNILNQTAIRDHIMYEIVPGSHLQTDAELENYVRDYIMAGNHAVGTCRMGRNKNDSVVNKKLKVHTVKRVRVADASVMPTIIRTNPASTVVMIAERAAEFMLNANLETEDSECDD